MSNSLTVLRKQEYDQRHKVNSLQHEFYEQHNQNVLDAVLKELAVLYELQHRITTETTGKAVTQAVGPGTLVPQPTQASWSVMRGGALRDGSICEDDGRAPARGIQTTGLEVEVRPRIEYVPTAIYHLFDQDDHPLVECRVRTSSSTRRRLRVSAFVEGYTAKAVKTIEISNEKDVSMLLLPTLFPGSARHIQELTRATLNVLAEDLDHGKVEVHVTVPIWLLSRNSAPVAVRDPVTGNLNDLSRYLGAFVTPNQNQIRCFLREVAEYHQDKRLAGYANGTSPTSQAKAIFDALKERAGIRYVSSVIHFNPEEGAAGQRVRLPRESLEEKQANCLDGSLLVASLLEATSINPAIVLIPNHAFVGWELAPGSDQWQYFETTMIATHDFDGAKEMAGGYADAFEGLQRTAELGETWFRRLSVRELRTKYHITPME